MYAIVETGGKQYRVKPGDTLAVEKLTGEPGEILDLDRVLLIAGNSESETRVGSPGVAGAVVRAEVLAHFRGNKIIVFRYKSKVRYRRKTGHRQSLTRLRITDILVDGTSSLPAETAAPEAHEATEPAPTASAEPVATISTSSETVGKPAAREAESAETPTAGHAASEPAAFASPRTEDVEPHEAQASPEAEA